MKLISLVSSDHDTSGCDYGLIDLSRDLARLAMGRVGMFKAHKNADPQLDEMYFWDYHVDYFSPLNAEEGDNAGSLSAILDELPAAADDLVRAPDDFAVPEKLLARIECSEMVVREAGIVFIAIPKHASYYIRAAEIPLQMIEVATTA